MQSPKKPVNHTNKVYYWDPHSPAAVQQPAAWETVVRDSERTLPNEIRCVYLSFLYGHIIG